MGAHDIEAQARWQMIIEDDLRYIPRDPMPENIKARKVHDMNKIAEMLGALAIFAAPVAFLYIVHGIGW
jgi:hypothetical protein